MIITPDRGLYCYYWTDQTINYFFNLFIIAATEH